MKKDGMSMRRIKGFSVLVVVILLMSACGHVQEDSEQQVVEIKLSDESILVDNHDSVSLHYLDNKTFLIVSSANGYTKYPSAPAFLAAIR